MHIVYRWALAHSNTRAQSESVVAQISLFGNLPILSCKQDTEYTMVGSEPEIHYIVESNFIKVDWRLRFIHTRWCACVCQLLDLIFDVNSHYRARNPLDLDENMYWYCIIWAVLVKSCNHRNFLFPTLIFNRITILSQPNETKWHENTPIFEMYRRKKEILPKIHNLLNSTFGSLAPGLDEKLR